MLYKIHNIMFAKYVIKYVIKVEGGKMEIHPAVKGGAEQGSALVYMSRGLAMVVSVKNRTVITALDDVTAADSIFTNIDSAAII